EITNKDRAHIWLGAINPGKIPDGKGEPTGPRLSLVDRHFRKQKGAPEMAFERSLEIARRLDEVLHLIRTGRYSTPKLAEKVGVSIPTISRIVAALRERGHDIRAERHPEGWRYVTVAKAHDLASILKEVERNERIGQRQQANRI